MNCRVCASPLFPGDEACRRCQARAPGAPAAPARVIPPAPVVPPPLLHLPTEAADHEPTREEGQALTFGRERSNDLVVNLPVVSAHHGLVRVIDGVMQVLDLRSRNGTFVAGKRISDWTAVGPADELRLGSYRMPPGLVASWRQQLGGAAATIPAVRVTDGAVITIGRDPGSTICIEHPTVSWAHARIERDGGSVFITDLRSTNGTFVNGERVRRAPLPTGAKVQVGSVPLEMEAGFIQAARRYRGEVRLDVRGVSRQLPNGTTLLDEVSFSVFPGEMVALMGPSGAGKTTLLEVLTGQRAPSAGTVSINDIDLHSHRAELAHRIGYVPQEDVMHRDLTVFEVLYFAARLRLPADLPDAEIRDQVERLMGRMGLLAVRDSTICSETVRGISGGQRKRVNIAIELLTEPPLLFLDEPTSGLDATATLEVLQLLRSLAEDGHTIFMTLHQPRIEAWRLVDMLLLLEKGGRLAYFGPAGDEAAAYFQQHATPLPAGANPADYVLDVLDATRQLGDGRPCLPGTWRELFLASEHHQAYVTSRLEDHSAVTLATSDRARSAPGLVPQLRALLRRLLRRKLRDRPTLIVQSLQPIVVAGLLAWIYDRLTRWPFLVTGGDGQDKCEMTVVLQAQSAVKVHAVLFLLGATAFWLGCSNVARELVAERAVFRRERMAGLSVPSYTISVFLAQALVGALQCAAMVALTWPAHLSLQSSPLAAFVTLGLSMMSGLAMGLVVSSLAASEVTAISMLPLLLLPQLILGGFIQVYKEMGTALQSIATLMPVRWAFEALLRVEYAAALPVCGVQPVFGFPDGPLSPPLVLGLFTLTMLTAAHLRLRATGDAAA